MSCNRGRVITWQGGYVAPGLVARYVASNNTGSGFSAATAVWKDLVGSSDAVLAEGLKAGTRQWAGNYFESRKVAISPFVFRTPPLPQPFSPEQCTLEMVFMPYTGSSNGDIAGIDDVVPQPYTTITLQMAALSAELLVEETATYTVVFRRTLVANSIYNASIVISPFDVLPVRNGRKLLYYNGVQVYSQPRTASLYVQLPEHTLSMLCNPVLLANEQIFFGRLYEVRLYNRALTPAEVLRNATLDRMIYGITT